MSCTTAELLDELDAPTVYYQDEFATIYHGDALDLLSLVKHKHADISTVMTDPPYGINTKSDYSGKLNPWTDLCNAALWYTSWLSQCRDILSSGGCLWSFMNWRSMVTFQKAACDTRWPIESLLVWDKDWFGPGGSVGLRPSYELVGLWCNDYKIADRGVRDIKQSKWSSKKPHGHPAEKPEKLIDWLLSLSPHRGAVLDPFMGSGTTLAAAKNRERQSIGIESDERYCEIAAERLNTLC